jgi:hypothetical protein
VIGFVCRSLSNSRPSRNCRFSDKTLSLTNRILQSAARFQIDHLHNISQVGILNEGFTPSVDLNCPTTATSGGLAEKWGIAHQSEAAFEKYIGRIARALIPASSNKALLVHR